MFIQKHELVMTNFGVNVRDGKADAQTRHGLNIETKAGTREFFCIRGFKLRSTSFCYSIIKLLLNVMGSYTQSETEDPGSQFFKLCGTLKDKHLV